MSAGSASGSFSIREYASKMRSVDVEKSWPFGGRAEVKRDEIGGLLPPIVCRKYRWWLDEVARLAPEVHDESTPEFRKAETVGVERADLKEISGLGLEKLRIEEAETDLGTGKAVLGPDEESAVKVCPVCGTFSASTVNAVNAHIDGCLVQTSRAERRQMREKKAKSRMQKKRSIVELFAVAPQIETVEEDGCDGDGEGDADAGEDDGGCEVEVFQGASDAVSKNMRRKKQLKELMDKMKKNQQKKKKRNKMMSNKKHGKAILSLFTRLGRKKEKVSKLKLPSEVDYGHTQQCSLHNKKIAKRITDPISIRKRRPSNIRSLLNKNQLMKFEVSKSFAKMQLEPPLFPIDRICENQSRAISLQKPSATGNQQGVNLVEQKKGRHSDKHVRFSGKDELLGHTKSWNSSNTLPQTKNVCEVFSDKRVASSVEDQFVEVDKCVIAVDEAQEVTGSYIDVSVSTMDGSDVQSVQDDRFLVDAHSCDAPCPDIVSRNMVCHDMENVSLDSSMDLNQPSLHHDSFHAFNANSLEPSHKLAGILRSPNYFPKERDVGLLVEGHDQSSTSIGSLHDPFVSPVATSTGVTLASITRNVSLRPLRSCFPLNMDMNEKQPYLSPGVGPNSKGCALHYQKLHFVSPKDLANSICFSTMDRKKQFSYRSGCFGESRSITGPILVCNDKCDDEDFIGLPLNSQGELINVHLNGKMGLSEVFRKQNMTVGTVESLPISNVVGHKSIINHSSKNDKLHSTMAFPSLKMFPEEHYLKNPTDAPASSTSDLFGMEKEQCLSRLELERHLRDISCLGCTAYNQYQNNSEKGKDRSMENSDGGFQSISQPTLRLMGKNVTVGKRNRDGLDFEDGKLWTDKEVIAPQHTPIAVVDHLVPRCSPKERITHPMFGISKKLNHIVEGESSPNSPSIFQMKPVEPRSTGRYNCQMHLMSLNGLPLANGKCVTDLPLVTHALLNKPSKGQKSCFSASEFVEMGHHKATQALGSQNDCLQHMLLNSTQSKHNTGHNFGAVSNFSTSFSNHENGGHGQPSYMQCSSPILPQMLNAAQHKETLYSYPSLPSDSFSSHHPCFMTRTNPLPSSSPYFTSVFPYPSQKSNITELCLQNPSTVTSLAPPHIPSLPAFRPMSIIKNKCRSKNTLMDSRKSKSSFSKDHGHSRKGKKRHAEKTDISYESVKKPNLEMQNSNSAIGSKNAEELCGHGEKMVDVDFSSMEIVKDGVGYGEKMVDVDLAGMDIVNDGLGTVFRDNALKADGLVRPGPVKLRAGTKHVLKPSQTLDRDNLRPTHSTLPCEVVTDISKVPDFEKKLAKIYRF